MNTIQSIAELDNALSRPTAGTLDTLRAIPGDVIVLGAGGKLGPTLAMMLRRAADAIGEKSRRIIAVSRFSSQESAESLQRAGVETIACDLLNRDSIQQLPDAPNVLYLVGQKFGTSDAPEQTWVTNTVIPSIVADRFSKSRIVVLSTGCVYPLVARDGPGATEDDPLGSVGEYANSCVGRERVFEYFSERNQTPMVFVRLCYAIDLRYGVLLDIANAVFRNRPISVSMAATQVIWQGDANARVIQSLAHTAVPPVAVNVTGEERRTVRNLALRLGELLGRDVAFEGQESATAWLWNTDRSYNWFGPPEVSIDEMLRATADWVLNNGRTLNRPTHFEVRDGQF